MCFDRRSSTLYCVLFCGDQGNILWISPVLLLEMASEKASSLLISLTSNFRESKNIIL